MNIVKSEMTLLKRNFNSFFEWRRTFARGSRFLPPLHVKDKAPDEEVNSKIEGRTQIGNESPEKLLENAASFDHERTRLKSMEDMWNSSPYPKGGNIRRSQAQFSVRPSVNPKETSIIMFPGQGTQFVGMGKELLQYPKVKEMYEIASSILKYDLLGLCLNGPKTTLDQTLYCQPAIVVTSLACLEKLRTLNPKAIDSCIGTAGFSVGEISALTFAGSLSFENAVKLVMIRAEAMHLASEMTPSGMMTVFYGPDSNVKGACSMARQFCQQLNLESVDCRIANYLYPDCKVIAGNIEALDFIEKNAADFKLRRLKRVAVSGAFHTQLMTPAVEVIRRALTSKIVVRDPSIAVHSNVDGKRYKNARHIISQLPKQIVSPVCWEQTMHIIYERKADQDFPLTYECGPGRSLKAILKMVNAKASTSCTSIDV